MSQDTAGTKFLANHAISLVQGNCAKPMEKEPGHSLGSPSTAFRLQTDLGFTEGSLLSTWLTSNSQKNPEHGG